MPESMFRKLWRDYSLERIVWMLGREVLEFTVDWGGNRLIIKRRGWPTVLVSDELSQRAGFDANRAAVREWLGRVKQAWVGGKTPYGAWTAKVSPGNVKWAA